MNEPELLRTIAASMARNGFLVDPALLAHLYVTLKSKPLIIVSGPPGSGKSALVKSLARVLLNDKPKQFQSMVGHAWWAGRTGNVALFTEAQTRLNTGKLMLLIDEARRPENAHQLYIACLNKISPAEVDGFFSEVAFQIQHERLMRLPSYHFSRPIPYPLNLIVIATMDNHLHSGIDDDFRSVGSVIPWQAEPVQICDNASEPVDFLGAQAAFLESRINNVQSATSKLTRLSVDVSSAIQSLCHIADLLGEYGTRLADLFLDHAMIYLANAWSIDGHGLFASQNRENLDIALDSLMAAEIFQPMKRELLQSDSLQSRLQATLNGKFPQASRILNGTNRWS